MTKHKAITQNEIKLITKSCHIASNSRLKLQSLTFTVTCYVTAPCDEFDLILGNGFMVSCRAVLDDSNFTASA